MKEARRLSFFGMDPRSTVYEREGRIFRANIDVELSCALLRDPTICSLMDRGALPTTRLIQDQEGSLLLEHQRIAPFTFPGEWSFSMLRDAGLATLALRDELAPAGYELQDAHSYNVGFDGCRPVFIDFASIVPRTTKYLTWRAGGEYRDAFIRILRIWSRANRTAVLGYLNSVWARSDDEALVVHGRHAYRLRSRFRRVRDKSLIATAMKSGARQSALQEQGFGTGKRLLMEPVLAAMSAGQRVLGHPFSTDRLRSETLRIPAPVNATMWADYQTRMSLHSELTPRFRRILEIVVRLGVRDAFEVAGNQGALSEALVRSRAVESVICSDYDEHSIDVLYRRMKSLGETRVTPMVYNVMMPDPVRGGSDRRLVGDVVIALALSHHLLLAQHYLLDAVLERIALHGRRFMIIEFMPKGLWDGTRGPPVPSWYRRDWFECGLARVGSIVLAEQLEENRVLFLVELAARRSGDSAGQPTIAS